MPDLSTAHIFKKARNTFVTTVLFWFLVAPPAIAQSLFATIGDYGNAPANEALVAGLVYGWNPEFIITLGDNRYGAIDYDSAVGQRFCEFLSETETGSYCSGNDALSNAFFPSLGNHDYTDGAGLDEYLDYFTLPGTGVDTSGTSGSERYYDFIRGPVHFFVIDSEGTLSSASDEMTQMNWLQAQLAASSAPWQVVYFHHPPYSSGPHGSTTAMQWPFASWGADAVIAGHDHTYERVFADGIVYFVNGLGGRGIYNFNTPVSGSQVRYNGDYGAMRVAASDTAITFEFINLSGSIIDTYIIEAGTPTVAFTYSCTDLDCNFTDTSTDDDGTVTGWAWDFGDGNSATTQHPSHSYAAAGTYTVSLTVTDDDGATNSTSQSVTVIGAGGPGVLDNGVPVTGLTGSTGGELRFTLEVPAGASGLSFQLSGGSGDADLYVQFGSAPTLGSYNCRPYIDGNNETCTMPSATEGTWHVLVHGYSAFANVSLVGSYAEGGGGPGVLDNGVPVTGLTGSTGGELRFTLEVPAGASGLSFQLSGGSGDADLYVQFGSAPTLGSYNCRPYIDGNNETCTMPSATEGTWHVLVRGYSAFANVSLVGSYAEGGGGPGVLDNGVPVTGLTGSTGGELRFTLEVPAGASGLSFQLSGGSGDADLYVQFGSAPTLGSYNCRPYIDGNNETCTMPSATEGTWHVLVRGYTAFANVSLVGRYTEGGGGPGVLDNGVPVTGLAGPTGGELRFTLEVPAGASGLSFQLSGGSGDADLYVQFGSTPTLGSYNCRPYIEGNNETCTMPSATEGTWHVLVRGYSAFANVSLVGSYTE